MCSSFTQHNVLEVSTRLCISVASWSLLLGGIYFIVRIATTCLSVHLLMSIWTVSSLGLLGVQLLLIFHIKCLSSGHMFPFLLNKHLERDTVKCIFNFKRAASPFPREAVQFYTSANHIWELHLPYILPSTWKCQLFWYLTYFLFLRFIEA